jgi:hypothetical protein
MSDWIQFLRDVNTKKSYKTFKQELEGERAYIKRKNIFDKVKQFKTEEKANEREAEYWKNLYYDGIGVSTFFKDRIPASKLRQLTSYKDTYKRLTGESLMSVGEYQKQQKKLMKEHEKEKEKEKIGYKPTNTQLIIKYKKGKGIFENPNIKRP